MLEFIDMAWIIKSGGVGARVGRLRAWLVWESAARGAYDVPCGGREAVSTRVGSAGSGDDLGTHHNRCWWSHENCASGLPDWTCA